MDPSALNYRAYERRFMTNADRARRRNVALGIAVIVAAVVVMAVVAVENVPNRDGSRTWDQAFEDARNDPPAH
jgi:hypothetical protein